jgi:hypothetical protein
MITYFGSGPSGNQIESRLELTLYVELNSILHIALN